MNLDKFLLIIDCYKRERGLDLREFLKLTALEPKDPAYMWLDKLDYQVNKDNKVSLDLFDLFVINRLEREIGKYLTQRILQTETILKEEINARNYSIKTVLTAPRMKEVETVALDLISGLRDLIEVINIEY